MQAIDTDITSLVENIVTSKNSHLDIVVSFNGKKTLDMFREVFSSYKKDEKEYIEEGNTVIIIRNPQAKSALYRKYIQPGATVTGSNLSYNPQVGDTYLHYRVL